MTPQALKASILQLAIQGKLVPQRPEEGTAEELYQQIQAEKQTLIAAGTIKKEKPLPPIEEKDLPFDIPETWKWVRWGEIVNVVSARRVHQSDWKTSGVPFYRAREIAALAEKDSIQNELYISDELYHKLSESGIPRQGDVMVTAVGTLGKAYIVKDRDRFYYKDASVICLENIGQIEPKYIKYALDSEMMKAQIKANSSGTTVGTLTIVRMNAYLIPLPPLAEQKRIVAKIEKILPLIDRYGEAYTELETFNKRFPDDLRKSILQEAIQGKLVPQRPEEGTAEELYQQIQAEKQRLIAAGTIKKEKPLPPIEEKDLPFDIPETWKWVRLGEIFTLQAGKFIAASEIQEKNNTTPYPCYGGNGCRGYVQSYNRDGDYPLIGRQGALCGNINRAQGKFYATEHAVAVEVYANTDVAWACLFLQALNLNQYATATAQPGLAVSKINEVLIPLPPLAEQQRIVAKIEELLTLCKSMQS